MRGPRARLRFKLLNSASYKDRWGAGKGQLGRPEHGDNLCQPSSHGMSPTLLAGARVRLTGCATDT